MRSLAATNIENARIQRISGCKFVKVEHLGTPWQLLMGKTSSSLVQMQLRQSTTWQWAMADEVTQR